MMDPAELQQQMMDKMLVGALEQVERAVDDELDRVENASEEDLAKIRANRVAEMKRKAEERVEQQRNGHGSLTKVNDQKEFFEYSKKSSRLVVLFTRDSNRHGKIMIEHLTFLAARHLEARFIWVDAENAPFLTDKLNIWMLPTIVCLKDNKVKEQHNGLDEIDSSGKYSSGMLEYLLHIDGMLDEAPLYDEELREEEQEMAESDDDN